MYNPTHFEHYMDKDLVNALDDAEDYFIDVIEQESNEKVVPSRTQEMHYAIEGLAGICKIKFKHWCMHKDNIQMENTSNPQVTTVCHPPYTTHPKL